MKIGYILPAPDHSADEQEAALRAAGVSRIYVEEVITPRRPLAMLTEAARSTRQGETLTVTRLSGLGRTKREALAAIEKVHSRGGAVELLAEGITTTAEALRFGKALAAADLEWGQRRGAKGVDAAAKVTTRKGRPRVVEPDMMPLARSLWLSGQGTAKETAEQIGVDTSTLYRLFGPRVARDK